MSIDFYTDIDMKINSDNPWRITINGVDGGIIVDKVYVRNSDNRYYYSNITVSIGDTNNIYLVDRGWKYKLIQQDYLPATTAWDTISDNNTISLLNIGSSTLANTTDYIPIFIYMKIPDGQTVDNVTDLYLSVSATQNLVVSNV